MDIEVAGQINESLSNGPGLRYVLFLQGCPHHCVGCHNKHTWQKGMGKYVSIKSIIENIKENPLIKGVTISGGEPFEQSLALYELIRLIKKKTNLNILIYTGYTLKELINKDDIHINSILTLIDILIDGKFEINNMDGAKKYTGSKNQNIYIKEKGFFVETYF